MQPPFGFIGLSPSDQLFSLFQSQESMQNPALQSCSLHRRESITLSYVFCTGVRTMLKTCQFRRYAHTPSEMSHRGAAGRRGRGRDGGLWRREGGWVAMTTHLCQFHSASLQIRKARHNLSAQRSPFDPRSHSSGSGSSLWMHLCAFVCICVSCELTVAWEMVSMPPFTEHCLLCHTFLSLLEGVRTLVFFLLSF